MRVCVIALINNDHSTGICIINSRVLWDSISYFYYPMCSNESESLLPQCTAVLHDHCYIASGSERARAN